VSITRYPSLSDRTVVVTGGATAIGADIVRAFAEQDSKVIFLDIQDDAGSALANQFSKNISYKHCDLTDTTAISTCVDEIVQDHGDISVLVNNAANDDRRSIDKIDSEFWDQSQSINVRAQFFMAQAAIVSMRRLGHGSIINLSSIAWRLGIPELTSYASAKAAILGLTKSLAGELGSDNIRVNAIEPGAVMTAKQRQLWYPTEKDVANMVQRQMIKKSINGADIARAVLFLAADDSRAITGQSLQIDAGFQ